MNTAKKPWSLNPRNNFQILDASGTLIGEMLSAEVAENVVELCSRTSVAIVEVKNDLRDLADSRPDDDAVNDLAERLADACLE